MPQKLLIRTSIVIEVNFTAPQDSQPVMASGESVGNASSVPVEEVQARRSAMNRRLLEDAYGSL